MKCLHKYQWVKLPRDIPDMGKGLMAHWAVLASRAAFRKGNASYCGHNNPVAPGMWAGGIVGLKSILGVRSRAKALQILGELSSLGFLKYSLDSQTKKLTYEITDWVVKCSGAECMSGTVYASTGYGFLCLPRSITQRLAAAKRVFDEADAWLDLWCHTTYSLRSGKIAIRKVDTTGEPLAGAEFLLEWSVDGSSWLPVVYSNSGYAKEGTCSSEGLTDGRLISGETGLVEFTGLHPERLYRLTETAAPAGFQLLADIAYEGGLPDDKEYTVDLTVVNVRTYELPETGSKSLLLMPIALILACGLCGTILFVIKRKKQ